MDEEHKIPGEIWRLLPHLYAERMSNGQWKAYDYLHVIGQEIFRAIFGARGPNGQGGRIIVSAPPRHGKSQFISKWVPIWFLHMFPERSVILASYEAEFAAHWGRQVRNEIQSNEDVKVSIREDSSAADRWETPEGGGMVTAGVGGAITGRGGHLIIVDDPVKNWQDATSATQREKAKNWFSTTLYTRAEPGATIVVLMTRWHEDDLAGWLLREKRDEGWKEIWLPAIGEAGDSLPGRLPGEALCPDRFNEAALIGHNNEGGIKKAQGPIGWNALYRQRPSSLEGDIIKRSYFKFYDVVPDGCTFSQSWDFSFGSVSDAASFVVGQVWARKGADHYLVHQVRKRMEFVDMVKSFRDVTDLYPQARTKIVENKAAGSPVISTLKRSITGIVKYEPKGSKTARLVSVSPFYAAGNIHVPDPSRPGNEWVKDHIEELVNMPNSPNDDQADAASQYLDYSNGGNKRAPVGAASVTRESPIPK